MQTRVKAILNQYYNIEIEIAEKASELLKQDIFPLTQKGDAPCIVHCHIVTHESLFELLMLKLYN